jgi:hypothetical protein
MRDEKRAPPESRRRQQRSEFSADIGSYFVAICYVLATLLNEEIPEAKSVGWTCGRRFA